MEIILENVLSLFDGISCSQIALNRAEIKYKIFFSSEIDKDCIRVTQKNYPNTIQIGDITKVKYTGSVLCTEKGDFEVNKINLIIGGSPCQGFSFAGKRLNFDDPRSKLFWEFYRLLKEVEPEYFILENVKMGKRSQQIITNCLGVKPIEINSSLITSQNRNRLYWTNIPKIPSPKEKGILLEDILETSRVDKEYYIRNLFNNPVLKRDHKDFGFKRGDSRLDFLKLLFDNTKIKHIEIKNHPYLICQILGDTPSGISRSSDRIYSHKGKSPCLVCFGNDIKISTSDNFWEVRTFTRNELERLQTVPEDYTSILSHNKVKRVLGNCFTVDVIVHLFKSLRKDMKRKYLKIERRKLISERLGV